MVTALMLLLVSPAHADDWTRRDTAWEAAYLTLHIIDWGQTLYAARRPDQYIERNRILGDHPSTGDVNRYFLATGIAHVGIAYVLPPRYRRYWQWLWIAIEADTVNRNYKAGVRIEF